MTDFVTSDGGTLSTHSDSAALLRGNEPMPDYGLRRDYPTLWDDSTAFDFAERLGAPAGRCSVFIRAPLAPGRIHA